MSSILSFYLSYKCCYAAHIMCPLLQTPHKKDCLVFCSMGDVRRISMPLPVCWAQYSCKATKQ